MYFMSFHVDSREGTRRANIFAGTATDAGGLVDHRDGGRFLVILIEQHHFDGSRRTMTGTVTALYPIGDSYAVLFNPNRMSNLYG